MQGIKELQKSPHAVQERIFPLSTTPIHTIVPVYIIYELCVARNKRRMSSARYKGVAKITTRCARKDFPLKYNPNSHYSASLYLGLNKLQYVDGRNILNLN